MQATSENPIDRFAEWLGRARAVDRALLPEPTAFALATADAAGNPSVRMLLLKDVDEHGFVFYTNLRSRKARELLATHRAAMCFHWQPLELQVRVEGRVSSVTDEEADSYFASRPRESQLGAWASLQSTPMSAADDLQRRLAEVTQQYEGVGVPRPPYWSGFRLDPQHIEFWTGRPFRLHLRELFTRSGDAWSVTTLFP